MFDIKKAREEFGKLHADATVIVDKQSASEITAEESKALTDKYAAMDKLQKQIDDATKLAKYSFENKEDKEVAPTVVVAKRSKEQVAYEASEVSITVSEKNIDREDFGRSATDWFRTGEMSQKYATITTASQSGIFLPRVVSQPIMGTAINAFRQAYEVNGQTVPVVTPTAINVPVLDANAGALVSESATSETENEPTITESIALTFGTYQSGSAYFSNLQLAAIDYDLITQVLPDLYYSKELGLESAIVSNIVGNGSIAQKVTTSGITSAALTFAKMQALNRALPKRYDRLKVIILGKDAFNAAEALTGTTGNPIFVPDAQNQTLVRAFGTPVLRSDYFSTFGSSNVIGCVISLLGFRLRDGGDALTRYTQVPAKPNQTGANLFSYHAYGYAVSSVALLQCSSS